jgi:DUF3016 family protein
MVRKLQRWLIALIPLLPGAALAASANVTFVHPEKFADIGPYADQRESARNQAEISHFLEQLAARRLPPDEALQIEVLDVDLAGRLEPWRIQTPYDFRVMVDVTWPSMKLRYRLVRGEQVLASGEESIADMNYLEHPNGYPTSDSLRYEKWMLEYWFQNRLVDRKPAPS